MPFIRDCFAPLDPGRGVGHMGSNPPHDLLDNIASPRVRHPKLQLIGRGLQNTDIIYITEGKSTLDMLSK